MRIGHVHLKVADLDRAIAFYRDVLGLNVTADGREAGFDAAFLAAGDYHHHIGLNSFDSAGGEPPRPEQTGLYHVAFVYPDREALADAVRRVLAHGHPIDHGTDHGATVSVYLADPDRNGIELYYDRPREEWFDDDGRPVLKLDYFDPVELLSTHTATRSANNMYAQLIEGGTTPQRRAEMDRIVTDELVPALQDEPGYSGALNLTDSSTGDAMMIILWQTDTQAERALSEYKPAFLKALANIAVISTGTRNPISTWKVNCDDRSPAASIAALAAVGAA